MKTVFNQINLACLSVLATLDFAGMYNQPYCVLDKCAAVPHGKRIYDTDGHLWQLMLLMHPTLLENVVAFESRHDGYGIGSPWYVLEDGRSGPVMQHIIASNRLIYARLNS